MENKIDLGLEIENVKAELAEIRANIARLEVGYSQVKLNLIICRAVAAIASALNIIQITH